MSSHLEFNPQRVFVTLFILTAVEVIWGYTMPYDQKWLLWGGLLIFAFWKAILIFMYFMHMKFEGWIVKCLIAPTPLLVAIVVLALMPDVARNEQLIQPVAFQYDPGQGRVVEVGFATGDPRQHYELQIDEQGNLVEAKGGRLVAYRNLDPETPGSFVTPEGVPLDRDGKPLQSGGGGH